MKSLSRVKNRYSISRFSIHLCLSLFLVFQIIGVSSESNAQSDDLLPGPILIFPVNNMTHLTAPIPMDWMDYEGAIRYQIQIDLNSDFSNPYIDAMPPLSEYIIEEIEYQYYYFWRVRAEVESNPSETEWTDWSETWRFKTFCLGITATLIEPEDGTVFQSRLVHLDWQANSIYEIFEHWVQVDDDPTFWSPEITCYTMDTDYETDELSPGQTYYWRIKTNSVCYWGLWSEVWSFTTCAPLPPPELQSPEDGALLTIMPDELTWGDVGGGDYQVQVDTTLSFAEPVATMTLSEPFVSTAILPDARVYYWRARGVDNLCDYENWSEPFYFRIVNSTICGDVDENELINILDIVYLINFIYKSGPNPPAPELADVNIDLSINILDIIYLINYIYKDGPPPVCG